MTPQQLELLVIQSVDRARRGLHSEDDRVELKREWPGAKSARQLAGAANSARGAELVYIIGVDESTGEICPPETTDVAAWWAQIESKFDQVAPRLTRHMHIAIDSDAHVAALEFDTSRSPYVVKVENGGATEREVPLRTATRTRSANRDELLRLLSPELSVPQLTVIEAWADAQWNRQRGLSLNPPEDTHVTGTLIFYVEPSSEARISLPAHQMVAEIELGHKTWLTHLDIHFHADDVAPLYGAHPTQHAIGVTSAGTFSLTFEHVVDTDLRTIASLSGPLTIRVRLGVSGASRPSQAEVKLAPQAVNEVGTQHSAKIGSWTYWVPREKDSRHQ